MSDKEKKDIVEVDDQESTHSGETDKGRRKVVTAGIIGTAAGAAAWHKPVVDSIVLPAHAQTSPDPGDGDDDDDDSGLTNGQVYFAAGDAVGITYNNPLNPLNLIVGEAIAGNGSPGRGSTVRMVLDTDNDELSYEALNGRGSVRRQGTVPIDGSVGTASVVEDCRNDGGSTDDHFITVSDIDADSITIMINGSTTIFLTAGDGTLPACEDDDDD